MRPKEPIDVNSLKKLSLKELEIMNMFWSTDKPLSRSDICMQNQALNRNTINVLIPRLLKEKFLYTSKIVQTKTVLARAYRPTVSRQAYLARELGYENANAMLVAMLCSSLEEENNQELIQELKRLIQKYYEEL